jgi:hypothetical protein
MGDRSFSQLLQVVAEISNRAADATGFVPLHALAREVHADVHFRPLLVEGVAAQPKEKDGRWLILIDNETHPISEEVFRQENAARPLGVRLRNTVAHELAHALGPRFEISRASHKSRTDRVENLEKETEQLSPALLIPTKAVEALLDQRTEAFDLEELVAARERFGVSSRVFVKRLELLNQETESRFRYHPRFDNLVIGSGEWLSSTKVELHPLPFRGTRGLIPEFVTQLRTYKKISIGEYFSEPDFYLNGGAQSTVRARLWLGTAAQPKSEEGAVDIFVEAVPRKADSGFLWMARSSELSVSI